jgi:hypothetical protein
MKGACGSVCERYGREGGCDVQSFTDVQVHRRCERALMNGLGLAVPLLVWYVLELRMLFRKQSTRRLADLERILKGSTAFRWW